MVHLLVPGQPPISIEALIDSGASDSFLDPSILVRYHLHPLPHPNPIQLDFIDGSVPATGPITHYFPSQLRVHGSHSEDLTFQVTRLGHFQMVLGFPWLRRHSPRIDWAVGTLTFDSPLCTTTCIPPPLPSPPPSSLSPPPPSPSPPPCQLVYDRY